jgi:hypothetical protein
MRFVESASPYPDSAERQRFVAGLVLCYFQDVFRRMAVLGVSLLLTATITAAPVSGASTLQECINTSSAISRVLPRTAAALSSARIWIELRLSDGRVTEAQLEGFKRFCGLARFYFVAGSTVRDATSESGKAFRASWDKARAAALALSKKNKAVKSALPESSVSAATERLIIRLNIGSMAAYGVRFVESGAYSAAESKILEATPPLQKAMFDLASGRVQATMSAAYFAKADALLMGILPSAFDMMPAKMDVSFQVGNALGILNNAQTLLSYQRVQTASLELFFGADPNNAFAGFLKAGLDTILEAIGLGNLVVTLNTGRDVAMGAREFGTGVKLATFASTAPFSHGTSLARLFRLSLVGESDAPWTRLGSKGPSLACKNSPPCVEQLLLKVLGGLSRRDVGTAQTRWGEALTVYVRTSELGVLQCFAVGSGENCSGGLGGFGSSGRGSGSNTMRYVFQFPLGVPFTTSVSPETYPLVSIFRSEELGHEYFDYEGPPISVCFQPQDLPDWAKGRPCTG